VHLVAPTSPEEGEMWGVEKRVVNLLLGKKEKKERKEKIISPPVRPVVPWSPPEKKKIYI